LKRIREMQPLFKSKKSRAVIWEDAQDQPSRDDEISTIGLVLDEAIAFKRVREDLIRLLSSDCPDDGICAVLDINQELLNKFRARVKRKIRRVEVDLGGPVATEETKEVSFWEFTKQTEGDLDLLAWPSYYTCMDRVKTDADCTLHAVDKSFHQSRESHASGRGIFFQRHDLIRLLRLNFRRKYPNNVVKYAIDNRLEVFRIECREVDRTTLLPAWTKGEHRQIRAIRFIIVHVQDSLFNSVINSHRLAAQVESSRVNQMLEVSNENVLLPPYEN
jgi:hypothetical protein